jgi:nifR3 family TIM-barrel protein
MALAIGNLALPSRLLLSPLAGVSDLPVRLIARGHGCRFAFAEMICARALARESARTVGMLRTSPEDRPLGIQLLGADPEIAARAAEFALAWRPDLLDLNAACPVRKVVRRGEGAALLKDPRLLAAVLRAVASRSPVPVTVKLRCGWSAASPPAREIALRARDAGAAAVFIHGRTMRQGYSGAVDYAAIRSVKEALDIPVVASGDALDPKGVKRLFDETGCDGALIARGALGNPWIFREAEAFLSGSPVPPRPGAGELASVMSRHLALCCGHYGEEHGVKVFRKHFAWYTRGLVGMKPFRERAFRAETQEGMCRLIEEMRGTDG